MMIMIPIQQSFIDVSGCNKNYRQNQTNNFQSPKSEFSFY